MEESAIKIEDLLFTISPDDYVSILTPVEDDVMDEPFDGSCMNHPTYGPCIISEGIALDMYISTPKHLIGAEVANIESVITKMDVVGGKKASIPAIRIVVKAKDKKSIREMMIDD